MGYSKQPHIKTHDFGVQDDLVLRDRSLVIAWGGGEGGGPEDFVGDHMVF